MAVGDWRFLTQRLTGTGVDELPVETSFLSDVVITRRLSTPPSIQCKLPVEVQRLKGPDGVPIFRERGTGLYAEDPNGKLYGGILETSGFTGSTWNIDAAGWSFYPKGQPYVEDRWWVDADPLGLHRHVWDHLQSLPYGNMGVELDGTTSPVRIGTPESADGTSASGEEGPFRLNWWDTRDLGKVIDDLATSTPFDWLEDHFWDGDTIRHRIRRFYPRLARRRHDGVRFEVGANVLVTPNLARLGSDWASDVLVLGEGEGRDRIAGSVSSVPDRPRWVRVIEDKGVKNRDDAVTRARQEHARTQGASVTVTELTLRNHPNAPLHDLELGDEVPLTGSTGWIDLNTWARIVGISISPAKSDTMVVAVENAESGGAL